MALSCVFFYNSLLFEQHNVTLLGIYLINLIRKLPNWDSNKNKRKWNLTITLNKFNFFYKDLDNTETNNELYRIL